MHDIRKILEGTEAFKSNILRRKFDVAIIDQVLAFNEERKKLIAEVEGRRAELNTLSKEIGKKKQAGESASELMEKVAQVKSNMQAGELRQNEVNEKQKELLSLIPNVLSEDVPNGKSEQDNVERRRWGTPKVFAFKPKEHWEIGEKLGMLDFEAAAKITGARFVFSTADLARLERALANFMLDDHAKYGYIEAMPPILVHARSLYGTGQLPKFKEDLFKIEGMDWYLIPTAEVPLTNYKREQLFSYTELPILFCGLTPCFRSEAGSYGKDTKGLIRMHQFNKVELVNIVEPSKSLDAHEKMIARAGAILEKLNIPYREITLCSIDVGFGSMKTIDLEVWLPGMNCYKEISSISNCGDFQARRADMRIRNDQGKPEYPHTLNGSGLAVGRTLVAVLENYQNEDGSVTIPEVLRPYMGGQDIIRKK